jgi:multidrug efflux pump subunit AcrA (membrane-fusion protein)
MTVRHPVVKKNWVVFVITTMLLVGGGIGLWVWRSALKQSAAQPTSLYQTDVVRVGSVQNSASGSGSLIANKTVDLSFSTSGTLAKLNVQPGDHVKAGDVLAVLDKVDSLKNVVQARQLDLQTAQTNLQNLQKNQSNGVIQAQAQATLAADQAAYADAQKAQRLPGTARCSQTTIEDYYYQYMGYQTHANEWESYLADGSGYGYQYIMKQLNNWRRLRDLAFANYTYCQGYTQSEIDGSQANLNLALANMQLAQSTYDQIHAADGQDADAVALAQAQVKNAQYQLLIAQQQLSGATITAPVDGIVVTVAANSGDKVGTGTLITLANLSQPLIQVDIDETDLQNMYVGCQAQVGFTSSPHQIHSGKVVQVYPQLVTVNGYQTAQGLVALTDAIKPGAQPLDSTATVQIICSQANNVLVVPLEALHGTGSNQPYVYVLNAAGLPEKRTVEVGLTNDSFAEIKSGLKAGEKVIISGIEGS